MTASNNKPHPYLIWAFIFICGFITGVGVTVYKIQPLTKSQTTTVSNPAPGVDHQELHDLEEQVKNNPNNFDMHVELGHKYFDSNQPQKAIEVYEKALTLHPGDANLWTDLGVMYRRTEQPAKAIESFDKAISIDHNHEPSRFNKGIVLLYDLGDPAGAITSFEELLVINPDAQSGNGGNIREFVDHIKNDLKNPPASK